MNKTQRIRIDLRRTKLCAVIRDFVPPAVHISSIRKPSPMIKEVVFRATDNGCYDGAIVWNTIFVNELEVSRALRPKWHVRVMLLTKKMIVKTIEYPCTLLLRKLLCLLLGSLSGLLFPAPQLSSACYVAVACRLALPCLRSTYVVF